MTPENEKDHEEQIAHDEAAHKDSIHFACDLCGKDMTFDSKYHATDELVFCDDCYHEDPEPYDVE